jgi:UDP-2,3-diacylglucosamine pyrophosphatase LpxH
MMLQLSIHTHIENDLAYYIDGDSMIVAVSDLHLGDKASNKSGFNEFIERYLKPNADDITHLFLLGDVLDLWRRDTSSVIHDNFDVLDSVRSLGFRVLYLVGNHDFIMTEMVGKYPHLVLPASFDRNSSDITVCAAYQLKEGNRKFQFIHGHQIDYWYALSFYQAFCKAMCVVDDSREPSPNVWELVLSYSGILSPILSSRISRLSEEAQEKIEQKLAGPLEGNTISKEESTLIELGLLHQFIEIGQLCPSQSGTDAFVSIRKEVRTFSDSFSKESSAPPSIEEISQIASSGTPEELVSRFITTWSDSYRWFIESKNKGMNLKRNIQLLHHLRRIAAMLTVNLQSDEFLIHGHGHQGEVDERFRTADTGCWLHNQASFITIDAGDVRYLQWLKIRRE